MFSKGRMAVWAAAGMLGIAGVAVPISASAGNPDYCDDVYVCIYKDSGFLTGLGARFGGFGLQNVSGVADNLTSSWENLTGSNARWYTGSGGSGTCNNMARNSELSWMAWGQNDELTSWAGDGSC